MSLLAEVLGEADRLLLVARLVVALEAARAIGDGLTSHLPQTVGRRIVPVVGTVDLNLRHGWDLLLLGDLLGHGLHDLLLGDRGLGLLRSLLRRSRCGCSGDDLGHDLLDGHRGGRGLLGDRLSLCLGCVVLVVLLVLGDEGVVGVGVLGLDALHDDKLLRLLGDTLEVLGASRLDVLDEGRPGERTEGGLALGLVRLVGLLTLLCLHLLADLAAALLADGGGELLVDAELLCERELADECRDLVNRGGHFDLLCLRASMLQAVSGDLILEGFWPSIFIEG
jgi:hypothetical protein